MTARQGVCKKNVRYTTSIYLNKGLRGPPLFHETILEASTELSSGRPPIAITGYRTPSESNWGNYHILDQNDKSAKFISEFQVMENDDRKICDVVFCGLLNFVEYSSITYAVSSDRLCVPFALSLIREDKPTVIKKVKVKDLVRISGPRVCRTSSDALRSFDLHRVIIKEQGLWKMGMQVTILYLQ